MDELLRSTLRRHAADPTAACVDVETAAAFVDGTLSARARSSAEAHLADCARCQAMLAALVRSTPPPDTRAWWRRPAVAWLIPAAVAAGAVAIWINVPDLGSAPPVQKMSGEVDRLDSAPIQLPVQPQMPAAPSRLEAAEAIGVRDSEPSAKARSVPSPSAAAVANREVRQIEANVAPPDAARAEVATSAAPNADTVTVSGAAPVVDTMSVARFRTALSPIIVSSNRFSQWRLGISGEVEHSADAGKTWQSQTIGVKATPVAGSSPSPSVCWLVGRDGLVLLTTDEGRSWRRVPFPAGTDLVSVRATDDRTATIVSVDGRTFATSDAGLTWEQ
jgi:hypothetical protein